MGHIRGGSIGKMAGSYDPTRKEGEAEISQRSVPPDRQHHQSILQPARRSASSNGNSARETRESPRRLRLDRCLGLRPAENPIWRKA